MFGLAAPTVLSLVVCPLICYPTIVAIRDRNLARRELQRLSGTDQLTNLLNRRGFDSAAKASLEAAGDARLAVMMLDVDLFKAVNDEFGHDFGDAALVHVAGILRDIGQEKDFIVGRQGGEEFIVLLTGATEADAESIANRVRMACAQHPVVHGGRSAFITISIGVAANPNSNALLSSLAARADAALYLAKRNGRNRVHLAEPVMPLANAA
jgi:diguanylate cyclase (GGDEF)-like protein